LYLLIEAQKHNGLFFKGGLIVNNLNFLDEIAPMCSHYFQLFPLSTIRYALVFLLALPLLVVDNSVIGMSMPT